jgi:hypothetical protein
VSRLLVKVQEMGPLLNPVPIYRSCVCLCVCGWGVRGSRDEQHQGCLFLAKTLLTADGSFVFWRFEFEMQPQAFLLFHLTNQHNNALVGKPEGGRPLERPRRRWEDNINMDLREVGWGGMDWINLAQDRDRWRALVNTVMNLRVR